MTAATARRHWHSQPGFRRWCGPCRYERRLGDARLLFVLVLALIVAALALGLAMQVTGGEVVSR